MLTVLIILNIVLAALLAVFAVKNLLIDFKTSEKWMKNALLISLIIFALVCSLIGVTESFQLKGQIDSLEYQLSIAKDSVIINGVSEKESIQNKLSFEETKINGLYIYPILGYLSCPIILFVHKKIIDENQKINTKDRWHLKDS